MSIEFEAVLHRYFKSRDADRACKTGNKANEVNNWKASKQLGHCASWNR